MIRRSSSPKPGPRLPHVAVIVPCYNYGQFLEECVTSILSQPGVTTEVLILDDASTDDSGRVAEVLADRDRRVRVTHHEWNRGHIATYNEGLSAADSDYVVLLSADDMLAPGALSRATTLMETHPSVGLVYGNPQTFAIEPEVSSSRVRSWSVWQGNKWIEAQFRRSLNIIYSPEAIVRTSVHHAAGYYSPLLPHSGDLEMWLRIAAISDVGRVNGPDQAFRRVHPGSMMQTNYGTVVKDLIERNGAFESFLSTAGANLPNNTELRSLLQKRMCQEALGWACRVGASSSNSSQEILEAVTFAQKTYPSYATLQVWHEFQQQKEFGGLKARIAAASSGILRDVQDRLRWRRWRRYGI